MPEIRFAPGSDTVRAYWLGCCPRLPGQAQGVSSGELFPDLGDYIIRFTLTLNGTKYTNHTVVRVEEPVREVDKRAYEWLSQQKWMYRQQWLDQQYLLKMLPVLGHARADQSLFQLVTPLQDQYHDSVYAEFVRGLMTTPAATIKPASKVNLEEEASTLENRPRWLDWLLGGALVLLAVILYRARKRQRLP